MEISRTDAYILGVKLVLRNSRYLEKAPGITVEGPYGGIALDKGVIIAHRHIHMTEKGSAGLGVSARSL